MLSTGIVAQSAKLELERAGYYPSLFFSTGVQYAHAGNRDEQRADFGAVIGQAKTLEVGAPDPAAAVIRTEFVVSYDDDARIHDLDTHLAR